MYISAATFPMIFIGRKDRNKSNSSIFTQVKSLNSPYPDVLKIIRQSGYSLPHNAIEGSNWMLTDATTAKLLGKMKSVGITLDEYTDGNIYRGLLTGFNKAFIIDGKKRKELINQDIRSSEIIKPLAVGDNIRKWRTNYKDKWLIYSPWNLDIDNYPAIRLHLSQWKEELKARPECKAGRYNWWCMARYGSEYVETLEKPKIIYPEIAKESRFTFDTSGIYPLKTIFSISTSDLYLLGVLNSASVWKYLQGICSVLGDANKGGRLTLQGIYLSKIPIPLASDSEKAAISKLVQKCLDAKGVDCEAWEKEINDRVAALYGL